jgi:putative Mg2+ transporter-C (MgtC) family protein
MDIFTEEVVKLLLALLVGGLIGIERDVRDKAAGFRTLIFICVGSTLFTIFSFKISAVGTADTGRIAANIVSGVGFLGAGVILRQEGKVKGLTTASTIWLVAALGMGIGAGQYYFTFIATGVVLVVLWLFPFIERWLEDIQIPRTYELVSEYDIKRYYNLDKMFRKSRLIVRRREMSKREDKMHMIWETSGRPKRHDRLVEKLEEYPKVEILHF